jgi:hypothetical protein
MKNHKRRVLGNKLHEDIVIGDSHARICASKIRQLLYNGFEVLDFVNPGSGMKFIKDKARVYIQRLKKKDVVVLWGGSNDVSRITQLRA